MNKSPRLKSLIIVVWSCTLSIHILIFFIFAVVLTAVEQKITPSVFTALRLALIICCQQSNSRICLLVTSSKGFFHLFFAPPPPLLLRLMQGETGLQLNRPKNQQITCAGYPLPGVSVMVNHVQTLGNHDITKKRLLI